MSSSRSKPPFSESPASTVPLKCFETGFIIPASEKIFGVSCPATNGIQPLCQNCIDKIPEAVRRKGIGSMCERHERGVDVYLASGETTASGYATFVPGKYMFSLSEANARKYFPESVRKLPAPISKKRVA